LIAERRCYCSKPTNNTMNIPNRLLFPSRPGRAELIKKRYISRETLPDLQGLQGVGWGGTACLVRWRRNPTIRLKWALIETKDSDFVPLTAVLLSVGAPACRALGQDHEVVKKERRVGRWWVCWCEQDIGLILRADEPPLPPSPGR
jgi:hypothetical protein